VPRLVVRPLERFLQLEAGSASLLLGAAVVALFWANLAGDSYERFWTTGVSLEVGSFSLEEDFRHVVNDLLMAVFFYVVALEVKRELLFGRTRLEVVASVDPHDSLDEIDVLPPEGSKLTGPETCEECGRPQRLVFRSERCEQLGRLARRDDSVSESFDSRKLKATRRVDRDLTPADRTAVDDANRRDRVADCGRIEPGCPQAVDELLDVEVAYLREESPSELGQDAVAQRLLVPAHDRWLVRLPVALRDLPFTRTGDPFARGFTKSSPRGWCQRSRPEGD
jgi:hypothetical protein